MEQDLWDHRSLADFISLKRDSARRTEFDWRRGFRDFKSVLVRNSVRIDLASVSKEENLRLALSTVVCEGGWLWSKSIDTRTISPSRREPSRETSTATEERRKRPKYRGRQAEEQQPSPSRQRPDSDWVTGDESTLRARLCP